MTTPALTPRRADWLVALAAITMLAGALLMGLIFFYAPTEATMGVVQKIFYIHVPSAIAGYLGFILCCAASVWYLLRGDVRADVVARAAAEVGVLFCLGVLLTGPIWARKAWGTWWTGEPRLLLTLVLLLIFVAYILVRQFGGRSDLTRKICAVLAILGVADIPLIRYSVERWRGSHPQVITGEGAGITPEMQLVLTTSFITFALLFVTLLALRVRIGLAEEQADAAWRAVETADLRAEDLLDRSHP
ncbi:MAG: hypothetical protein EA398_18010 [Deltaproteobacteria bacterium]|nr:MAG: hypothetical protein EA398_18010 [Deltaproteobacteria bacterium]